jgi:hypothetical protein
MIDMDAYIDATNPRTQRLVLALAKSMDCSARITVPMGHGLKPGMSVTFSHGGGPHLITSVTATTCVVRAMTRREAWRRAVRLWWRAWDAMAERAGS